MFSNRRRRRLLSCWGRVVAVAMLLTAAGLGCHRDEPDPPAVTSKPDQKSKTVWDRSSAQAEYLMLQAELTLAKIDKPYLVLDFKGKKLKLKLRGAVVWTCPLQFPSDNSGGVTDFVDRFRGDDNRLARQVIDKYLFAASGQISDTILAIVGRAVSVAPEMLQRVLPERFQLRWDAGLILEVRTDISGKPTSKFQNAIVEISQALYRPFGETTIVLKLKPEDALTLYRATSVGMPTLIIAS